MLEKIRHLNNGQIFHGFKVKKMFDINEFRLNVVQLHHEKSAANLTHLIRDDPNQTFGVQFRTTPFDNSGVSHILEHTALCGSQKYPVRDPFFKMLSRSMATFMNAYTANDWTLYPFSTMNSIDYKNLLSVYADAAFFPNLSQTDFMQEGWRLEPENLHNDTSKILLKGVVYNEMKGVFSNSLNFLGQSVENKLLPVSYGFVSGGHPDDIPSLSWEALKKFHTDHYHPGNANIYTYGNVQLEECLEYLDTACLRKFSAQNPSPSIPLEPKWSEPRKIHLTCQPDPTLADASRTGVVSLSFALADIRDVYTNFALSIATMLLMDGDSAPLYRGLIESGLGLDWAVPVHGMDKNLRTTCFHVGLQGVRPENVDQIDSVIMDLLVETVKNGFPRERIDAILHQHEIAIREDSASFGLQLILGISSIVNHGGDLQATLSMRSMVKRFKDDLAADPTFLQRLISQYLVENPHRLTAIMLPSEDFEAVQTVKEAERVQKVLKNFSDQDKANAIQLARDLSEKQIQEEDVSCLPSLTLVDIPHQCRPEPFTETQIDSSLLHLNQAPTNGLVYFHALADISDLSPDLLIYVPIFASLFSKLGADGLTYQEMDHLQDLNTGSLGVSPHTTSGVEEDLRAPCARHLHISAHCLDEKVPKMFELLSKRLLANNWLDSARLSTLVNMITIADWTANSISHTADHFAMRRASANLSSVGRLSELWSGIEQASFMHLLALKISNSNKAEQQKTLEDLIGKMQSIANHAFTATRLRFSLHGLEEDLAVAGKQLQSLIIDELPSPSGGVTAIGPATADPPALQPNVYVALPYSVHYASLAFPAPHYMATEFPAYQLLARILNSKFLHRKIREQGGAYGGGARVAPGRFAFYSYRDPCCDATLKTFEESLDFALSAKIDEQTIMEAKLSVFKELDCPVSAGARGLRVFLTGITDKHRQAHRERLFLVDEDAVKKAARELKEQLRESINIGRAVLGPADSSNWQKAENWSLMDMLQK